MCIQGGGKQSIGGGDDGGPVLDQNNRIVGVISFSANYSSDRPNVAADVAIARQWIYDVAKSM
jgi:hypothetical protein